MSPTPRDSRGPKKEKETRSVNGHGKVMAPACRHLLHITSQSFRDVLSNILERMDRGWDGSALSILVKPAAPARKTLKNEEGAGRVWIGREGKKEGSDVSC